MQRLRALVGSHHTEAAVSTMIVTPTIKPKRSALSSRPLKRARLPVNALDRAPSSPVGSTVPGWIKSKASAFATFDAPPHPQALLTSENSRSRGHPDLKLRFALGLRLAPRPRQPRPPQDTPGDPDHDHWTLLAQVRKLHRC